RDRPKALPQDGQKIAAQKTHMQGHRRTNSAGAPKAPATQKLYGSIRKATTAPGSSRHSQSEQAYVFQFRQIVKHRNQDLGTPKNETGEFRSERFPRCRRRRKLVRRNRRHVQNTRLAPQPPSRRRSLPTSPRQ